MYTIFICIYYTYIYYTYICRLVRPFTHTNALDPMNSRRFFFLNDGLVGFRRKFLMGNPKLIAGWIFRGRPPRPIEKETSISWYHESGKFLWEKPWKSPIFSGNSSSKAEDIAGDTRQTWREVAGSMIFPLNISIGIRDFPFLRLINRGETVLQWEAITLLIDPRSIHKNPVLLFYVNTNGTRVWRYWPRVVTFEHSWKFVTLSDSLTLVKLVSGFVITNLYNPVTDQLAYYPSGMMFDGSFHQKGRYIKPFVTPQQNISHTQVCIYMYIYITYLYIYILYMYVYMLHIHIHIHDM